MVIFHHLYIKNTAVLPYQLEPLTLAMSEYPFDSDVLSSCAQSQDVHKIDDPIPHINSWQVAMLQYHFYHFAVFDYRNWGKSKCAR